MPLIVYDIAGRTSSKIVPETLARLSEIRNIVAIKEASGSMGQTSNIRRLCGDRLTILSGDDSFTLPLMALGAKGVVATVSNVMPRETHELAVELSALRRGRVEDARENPWAGVSATYRRLITIACTIRSPARSDE